jgi:hypothetical protein
MSLSVSLIGWPLRNDGRGVGIYISGSNKVGSAVVVVFSCQGANLLFVLLDHADDVFWTSPLEIFTNLHMAFIDL